MNQGGKYWVATLRFVSYSTGWCLHHPEQIDTLQNSVSVGEDTNR
jgi:hypothetical protein